MEYVNAVGDILEHHLGALTFLIAIATVALALFANLQWRETRETAKRQLRAYVYIDGTLLIDGSGITPPPHIDRTDQPGINVAIKNSGQTPAKDVIHWGDIQVDLLSREWAMNPPAKLERRGPFVLPPQAISNKPLWLNRPLSPQEKIEIQSGVRAIFLFGRVEYTDEFGHPRWSTYRMRYTESRWPPYGNSAAMGFCDSGNDGD